MIIFVSKTSDVLNKKPYDVENLSNNICLNPMYKRVSLSRGVNVLMDSGAFQNEDRRLSFEDALSRQLTFARSINSSISCLAAYDRIDDRLETIKANNFILNNTPTNITPIVICQGKNREEYLKCLYDIIELSHSYDRFILGFGGIAKSGMNKVLEDKLFHTIEHGKNKIEHIKQIHLFGVFTNRILKRAEQELNEHSLSCDTASIEIRSVMGNVFDGGKWVKTFSKPQKYVDYDPNVLAKCNVVRAINYYRSF